MYVTAASLVPFFKLGVFLGWFRGEPHFVRTLMTDASPVFLAARMLSATAGVVSVWVLFRIAGNLFGKGTALVAAWFLALAFLHVRDSHFGVTDIPATCLVLVCFLFTLRFWKSYQWRDLILAAVAAGLATSTKYNAALIALPALWVVFRPLSATTTFARQLVRSAVFAVIMVLAFGLTSPYCFIEFERWIDRAASDLGASVGWSWRNGRARLGRASDLLPSLWTRTPATGRWAGRTLFAGLETASQGSRRRPVSGSLLGPRRKRRHGVRSLHIAGGPLFVPHCGLRGNGAQSHNDSAQRTPEVVARDQQCARAAGGRDFCVVGGAVRPSSFPNRQSRPGRTMGASTVS